MRSREIAELVGFAVALLGLAALVYGVALVSVAAAFCVGGAFALAGGWLIVVAANRGEPR